MKNPTTKSTAWEQEPFWCEVAAVLTGGKKLRGDHYLQNLSAAELEQLQSALASPGRLVDQQKLCPPRRGGATDGDLPPLVLLSELSQAVREVKTLRALQRQDIIAAATKDRCGQLGLDPALTNAVVRIVAEEALRQQAENQVGNFAISAAQVLLSAEGMRTKGSQEERKIQLRKSKLNLDERDLVLKEKKAAAFDRAQELLTAAKTSKGGITKETIKKIEAELNLL